LQPATSAIRYHYCPVTKILRTKGNNFDNCGKYWKTAALVTHFGVRLKSQSRP